MPDCCECGFEARTAEERRVLRLLLAINATMFAIEFGFGWLSRSTGLLADSLDMLADAFVYGLSLYAVGRAAHLKARAAFGSGILQILLGLGVLAEIAHRLVAGEEPQSALMIAIGALALAANVSCLALLSRYRQGEVHMRASYIFSANDVLANIGVMLAGVLVSLTSSRLPDLVIGLAIALLVMRGGLTILHEAREARAE